MTEQLIQRYLDGTTTCAEEEQLRCWFHQADRSQLSAERQALQLLMGYVDSQQSAADTTLTPRHIRTTRRLRIAAVAASIILLVSIGLTLHRPAPANYALIDGQRCADAAIIQQEAEQALQLVTADTADDFGALQLMN